MEHDPVMIAIGVGLFVVLQVAVISVFIWHRRANRAAALAMESERGNGWYATVTGSAIEEVTVHAVRRGPGAGGMRKVNLIKVTYRRDDGNEGHVLQYEGEIMNRFYNGALAYYVHAPAFDVLRTWRPGERLHKLPGDYFPTRVREPVLGDGACS